MTLSKRLWLAVVVLLGAFVLQAGLLAHMIFGPQNTYAILRKPLSDLPLELPIPPDGQMVWKGQNHPSQVQIRERLPFQTTDLIYRNYRVAPDANLSLNVYMVHTRDGEDRKHHPEICIRDVEGMPEDPTGKMLLYSGGNPDRTIQRFCFHTGAAQITTVYYWHYTFLPQEQHNQTGLQRLHQTFSQSPPSVTVQVSTTAPRNQLPFIERTFVGPLDNFLRAHYLPNPVKMGCDRLPIGLVRQ